jgi:hypothetical protein
MEKTINRTQFRVKPVKLYLIRWHCIHLIMSENRALVAWLYVNPIIICSLLRQDDLMGGVRVVIKQRTIAFY